MAKKPKKQVMTITEAVDNLSSMAEIDAKSLEKERKAIAQGELDLLERRQWLDLSDEEKTYASVKESFKTVHDYLKGIYKNERDYLHDVAAQKGIHALMQLAGEAAQRINTCSGLFKKAHREEDFTQIKEFKDLEEFYLDKIVKKFQKEIESEEAWQEEWGGELEEDLLDIERRGLKELEQVRKDRRYELFYIRKEDGKPFFNQNLLRHIRLVLDFDEMIAESDEGDPRVRARIVQDKMALHAAESIHEMSVGKLNKYLKHALKFKNEPLITMATCGVMALLLASNHRNFIQHSTGKSCLDYMRDFFYYLRAFLSSVEYTNQMKKEESARDLQTREAIELIHAYCGALFLRISKRDDAIGYIYRLIEKGSVNRAFHRMPEEPQSMWNALLDYQDSLRNHLKKYPNGPLMLLVDLFEDRDERSGFEPFKLHNYPSKLFELHYEEKMVSCLRVPSPTIQEVIDKAKIIPEFKVLMRDFETSQRQERLLLFNLQDRTSWEEHARSAALEKLQDDDQSSLTVVTLPKDTDFYHQAANYIEGSDAKEFIRQLKEQFKSPESCGFFFPKGIKKSEISSFVTKTAEFIHKGVFGSKKSLTRKNRLDFIEILYLFLITKIIELTGPTHISFTCKDAIDVGEMQSVAYFAFMKLMSRDFTWSEEERDFLAWMVFAPALLVRNRSPDSHRLSRTVSALSLLSAELDVKNHKLAAEAKKLFEHLSFSKVSIEEAKE